MVFTVKCVFKGCVAFDEYQSHLGKIIFKFQTSTSEIHDTNY